MQQIRTVKEMAVWALAILLIAIIASTASNSLAAARYRRLYPPPGKLYWIDGHTMHLYCTGTGSPTLILEAGLGDDWLTWRKVQPALSALTRVCSYDRARYGWSDPRPSTRDTDHIVEELHALISQAEISGPVLLMGHSAGGLHIRKYTTKYPEGIVGFVFVDASTPEQMDRLPAQLVEPEDLRWAKVQTILGIPRLRGRCGDHDWTGLGAVESDSPAFVGWLKADDCLLSVLTTTEQEEPAFKLSGREVAGTGPFGDLPGLIFSQDTDIVPPFWSQVLPGELASSIRHSTWVSLQEGLKKLSTRSRRIVAKGSSHYVQVDRPEVVVAGVGHMIRAIRGLEPAPDSYGSTTVE